MPNPTESRAWHATPWPEVVGLLRSSESGLTSDAVARRLAEHGPNRLPTSPPPAWWKIVARQFRNPLIYILGFAAALSLFTQHLTDAAFIVGVLLLNAAIGAVQEWKAERSAQALQKLLRTQAVVERDGDLTEIDAEAVVPGDIVWLESGNRVPADLRLFDAHALEIDESLLTGESLPVGKDPGAELEESVPVADRSTMAHAGTIVVRGRARGMAVATATATAVGQLALSVVSSGAVKPPLILRMERFTRSIGVGIVGAAVIIGLVGVLLRGQGVAETVLFGVALVVSAIPEGLPIAMTVALAIAANRMARRGLIVRRLTAVEGLGSCTYVATDKTGTLTANELTVRAIVLADGSSCDLTGSGFVPDGEVRCDGAKVALPDEGPLADWVRVATLCNEADLHSRNGEWIWRGDPVDVALLVASHKLGVGQAHMLERHPQVNQIAFEPERRFAATFHREGDGQTLVAVKGAPEQVLEMCDLPQPERARQLAVAEEMAGRGLRVLAFAGATLPEVISSGQVPPEPGALSFIGFSGMIDPLRPEAREAVQRCLEAGVQVCMVTGDHRVTALAIARDLGLDTEEESILTGAELAASSEEELQGLMGKVTVFARVEPRQKLRIVEAARASGHFVAVTGDGVNDAPALRTAHIGVAMGKSGTDVAREAAELVISDDNFATVVAGIEEGRIAYDNIRNVIYLLISTGAAEIVLVALAVIFGTPLPLLPVQLLWLNLVTQGIQDWALAFESGEKDVLKRKPRPPDQRVFDRLMIERTVLAALVMGVVGFSVFMQVLPEDYTPAELAGAQNTLLLLMVLFENIHIGNCRSEIRSAFVRSPFRSPVLLIGVACAFLAHLAAMYLPFMQTLLGTAPVEFQQWIWLSGLALTIAFTMEFHKLTWWWRARRQGGQS